MSSDVAALSRVHDRVLATDNEKVVQFNAPYLLQLIMFIP